MLINRKDDSTEQSETTLYIGENADVTAGKLYIVNRFNRCDSDFSASPSNRSVSRT